MNGRNVGGVLMVVCHINSLLAQILKLFPSLTFVEITFRIRRDASSSMIFVRMTIPNFSACNDN